MSKCIYHKNDEEDESDVSSDVDGNEDDEYPLVDPEGGRCVEGRCQDTSNDSMPDTDQTDRHHRRQNVEVLCVCVYIYIVYIYSIYNSIIYMYRPIAPVIKYSYKLLNGGE